MTPYVLPLPLPVRSELRFGAPLSFPGTGDESQHAIQQDVDVVKAAIAGLIAEGREGRQTAPRALGR